MWCRGEDVWCPRETSQGKYAVINSKSAVRTKFIHLGLIEYTVSFKLPAFWPNWAKKKASLGLDKINYMNIAAFLESHITVHVIMYCTYLAASNSSSFLYSPVQHKQC